MTTQRTTTKLQYKAVSSKSYDIVKMSSLELNKEYFVKDFKKTKYGYICTTLNASINFKAAPPNELASSRAANGVSADDLKIRKLTKSELKDETNSIKFYSNKSLNEYINNENVKKFCIRITNLKKYKEFLVPEFEIAIIETLPDLKVLQELDSSDEDDIE